MNATNAAINVIHTTSVASGVFFVQANVANSNATYVTS